MNASLEYYKYFYYTASYGSISLAADKLCVSQPAVSQALKNLETTLGGKLFLRTSKGVKLTPEGNVLYEYISKAFNNIEAGEKAYGKLVNMESGELRIGASDMTLQFFLLPYLETFHERYPDIKINVTNAPTPETLSNLKEGKIDFGIVSTPFAIRDGLSTHNVREIETIFIAGPDYSHLKGKSLPLNVLESLPLICLEGKTSTRYHMDEHLKKHGIFVEPEFELATSDMIVQFAIRNLGIGCVVRDFAEAYIKNNDVFELKFENSMAPRSISIITDNHNTMSGAAHKLLEIII